jgi:hypothetical protein
MSDDPNIRKRHYRAIGLAFAVILIVFVAVLYALNHLRR